MTPTPARLPQRWLALLSLLLAGASACPALAADTTAPVTIKPAAQRNAGLATGIVQQGALVKMIDAMGTVTTESSRVVRIHPAGSGKVLSVAVIPGQHVRKGDVLLTYQDHSLHLVRLQMTQALAARASALAAYQNAQATYNRGRQLEGTTVAAGETRRRLALLATARNDVAMRQADIDTLRHQLDEEYNSVTESDHALDSATDETSLIVAPGAAEVQDVQVGVADDITPATELVALADMSVVRIVSDILPQDAARVEEGGEQVTRLVTRDGRSSLFRSKVTSVGSLADPATGLVRVISLAPNPDGVLRPGMFLDTMLPTHDNLAGLLVPSEAVIDVNGVSTVFVPVGEDRFRARTVRVGGESDGRTVILDGLSAGEKIVMHGAFALKASLLMSDMADGD